MQNGLIGVGDLKLKPFFRCKRDAEKKVLLTSAPAHLNITLLRFKYDRSTNRRAKVFTGVDYPHTLLLPVGDAQVSYSLFSVVVHSGYSSDGGHYYTWAKNSETGAWSLLNDSLVTEQSWAQFAQMTRFVVVNSNLFVHP